MKQLTIFDVIADVKPKEKPKDIPCGYTEDTSIVGSAIPFTELKNYIGKKVIKSDGRNYKVYQVIEYFESCDTFYKRVKPLPDNDIGYGEIVNEYIHDVCGIKECMSCYEPAFKCDRIALSDNGGKTANSWISEAYCSNGRFRIDNDYPYTFYEIRQM